jgi:hypothetical protein
MTVKQFLSKKSEYFFQDPVVKRPLLNLLLKRFFKILFCMNNIIGGMETRHIYCVRQTFCAHCNRWLLRRNYDCYDVTKTCEITLQNYVTKLRYEITLRNYYAKQKRIVIM